ncbi:tRNA (adenosine(37)-N6)-threonylcarbamoyltransferase complex transferase subunit TsaD [Acuticoccus sediminis]|uniref:tRNA N6-adenosine threonylcarbamoyltransferase n=1 Tax=Acuticoccus sediminis TaxID=2184697 RepID=A0A8B2NZK6_9HYPH|nr:tRNA (adenosine(37)-N6)-threonylcarbamoyltransferase complex transferase subunit TsaD [Acuticoccus sediminis]RAI03124.1 tRNA (adenosine(37)-N6)-threonylcarbamoyltransferase complex transferase subunit TsaD [Acuticoccus sediminis]
MCAKNRGPAGPAEPHVIGIETSCDECAVAIVAGRPGKARILSNVVLSQIDLHQAYGGVVPEIAARAHGETIDRVTREALAGAGVDLGAVTHVAATAGPGLLGGLLVGATFGRALAAAADRPFVPVNHLEAHVLSPRLSDGVAFPYCVALLSGGHAQFVAALEPGVYRRLGGTIDDAAGEAFDKTAKLLGLGYPGGPAVEAAAREGDPKRYAFPTPLARREGCDLSFAGLKTAVRLAAEAAAPLTDRDVADICASFQDAVARLLVLKSARALEAFRAIAPAPTALVAVGGVAANGTLRAALAEVAARDGLPFVAPPLSLCGDNGAMIAYTAIERVAAGLPAGDPRVRSRWPLDATAAPMIGAGKRGAKA